MNDKQLESRIDPAQERPEGFRRVSDALAARGHPHAPVFLNNSARTAQEAADALGVTVGQIAKSIVFRRRSDDAAVLVVTSGDKRVDEAKAPWPQHRTALLRQTHRASMDS